MSFCKYCRFRSVLAVAMTVLATLALSAAAGTLPWDESPFVAPYARMLAAANAQAKEGSGDVQVLLREVVYRISPDNRVECRSRWVYRILTEDGIENWSDLETSWEPWHQARPQVRVRVSNPDGKEHFLSPRDLLESSSDDDGEKTYSDTRTLKAPFPGVVVGSIVEEEIVTRDQAPFSPEGALEGSTVTAGLDCAVFRLVVETRPEAPFVFRFQNLPEPRVSETLTAGWRRREYTWEDLKPKAIDEKNTPPDIPRNPGYLFSTCPSWEAVSTAYARFVEDRLRGEDFSPVVTEVRGKTLRETLDKAAAWVQERVRYTGLELGERSIVPEKPSVVLQRGFGDCKDQSLLLTGILRQAGLPACMALVCSGPGDDIDPAIPGLGNFDHTLVVVTGKELAWVDPVGDLSRDGALPLSDQGRWALIVDRSVKNLVKTPRAVSTDNRILEERDVELSDQGAGRVRTTLEYHGEVEQTARATWSGLDAEEQRRVMREDIVSEYRQGQIGELEVGDAEDLSGPFRVAFTVEKMGRSITVDDTASLALMNATVTTWLPELLKEKPEKPRRQRFLTAMPFVHRVVYRISPPAGFVLRTLPESGVRNLGAVRLERTFSVLEDGRIQAVFSLDSGQSELTPEAFTATAGAVSAYLAEKAVVLNFDHRGKKALAAGDSRGALSAYSLMAALEPAQAGNWLRLARIMLRLGFGESARVAARNALLLAPGDARIVSGCAEIFLHDRIGRRFAPGWDRDEALRCCRAAVSLSAPDPAEANLQLAEVLERDARGMRCADPADLAAAAVCYRSVLETLPQDEVRHRLAAVLADLGRSADLTALAETCEDEAERESGRVLALAVAGEADRALAKAAEIFPGENRRTALTRAAEALVRLRRYAPAARFLRAAAVGAEDFVALEGRADHLDALARSPAPGAAFKEVEVVARHYLAALLAWDGRGPEPFGPWAAPDFAVGAAEDGIREALARPGEYWRSRWARDSLPASNLPELALSAVQLTIEGDEAWGWDVHLTGETGPLADHLFLARVDGRLLVVGDSDHPAGLGRRLLQWVDAGRAEAAGWWLNRLSADRVDPAPSARPDPLAGDPFRRAWEGASAADPARMRLAAAVFLGLNDGSPETRATLARCRAETSQPVRRAVCDQALVAACLRAGETAGALQASEALARDFPASETTWKIRQVALTAAGRVEEAEKACRERLAREPANLELKRWLLMLLHEPGRYGELCALFRDLELAGGANAGACNNRAWYAGARGEATTEDLAAARRAVALSGGRVGSILHTCAVLCAEAGRGEEAVAMVQRSLAVESRADLLPRDWYVLGLLAQGYGLAAEARAAYERAAAERASATDLLSCRELARRRLQQMAPPEAPLAGGAKP